MANTSLLPDRMLADDRPFFRAITGKATELGADLFKAISHSRTNFLSSVPYRRILIGLRGTGKTRIVDDIQKQLPKSVSVDFSGKQKEVPILALRLSLRRIYGRTLEERLLFFLRQLRLDLSRAFGFIATYLDSNKTDVPKALLHLQNEVSRVENLLGGTETIEIKKEEQEESKTSRKTEQQLSIASELGSNLAAKIELDVSVLLKLLTIYEKSITHTSTGNRSAKGHRTSIIEAMKIEPALYELFAALATAGIPSVLLVDNLGRLHDDERATIIGLFNRLPLSGLIMTLRGELFDKEIAELFEPEERVILPAMTGVQLKNHIDSLQAGVKRSTHDILYDLFRIHLTSSKIDEHQAIFPPLQTLEFFNWISTDPCISKLIDQEALKQKLKNEFHHIFEHYLLSCGVEPRVVEAANGIGQQLDDSQIRTCLLLGSLPLPDAQQQPSALALVDQLDLLCQEPVPLAFRHRNSYWLSPFIAYLGIALQERNDTQNKIVKTRKSPHRKDKISKSKKGKRSG